LGFVLQIVGGHPHLLLLHDPLLVEVRLATVDEDERVRLAIVAGEVHLLETGRPIGVVLTVRRAARHGGAR
jgi:hypothetical protein